MSNPDGGAIADDIEVSVILAVTGRDDDVTRSLDAIRVAATGCRTEVIVVAHTDVLQFTLPYESEHFRLKFESVPVRSLTPCLWASGYRRAIGHIVAFTTTQCVVPASWIAEMRRELATGTAGAGGPLVLDRDASATDWAVFHLRYSAFLGVPATHEKVREIPGDNAAYFRDLIACHESAIRDGFWEVELHRMIRAEGYELRMVAGMTVTFSHASAIWTLAAQRFEHGEHSGWWRVHTGVRKRWQIACAAPLVPLVLLSRILRAIHWHGGRIRIGSLPALGVLTAAWAAGEAVGAFRRVAPVRCRRT